MPLKESKRTPARYLTFVSTGVVKTLTEGLTLTDSAQKDAGKNLPQALTLADVLDAKPSSKSIADTATLQDTIQKGVGRILVETGLTLLDPTVATQKTSGATNHTKDLTEAAALTGSVERGPGKVLPQSLGLSGVVQKAHAARVLTEGTTLGATLSLTQTQKQLAESLTLGDSPVTTEKTSAGNYSKNLTETAALTGTFVARKGTQQLTEGLGLAASVEKGAGKSVAAQSLVLADTRTEGIRKERTEGATLGDTFSRQVTYYRTLTEQAFLTDPMVTTQQMGVVNNWVKNVTEQLTLTAGYLHATDIVLCEVVSTTDSFLRSVPLKEVLSLSGYLSTTLGAKVSKSQTVQLLDGLTTVYTAQLAALTEQIGLVDVLDITGSGKILTERLSLGDAVLVPDTYTTESSLVFAG